MTTEPSDELSPNEQKAYASLRERRGPSEALEGRVTTALRARGLLAPRRTPGLASLGRWAAALAAGALLFAAGLAVGQKGGPGSGAPVNPMSPRFVLFLHEDKRFENASPEPEAERVGEYRRWAEGLRQAGHFVTGEKLTEDGMLLFQGGPGRAFEQTDLSGDDVIGGFFVVSAADYEAALALARACPHLRHGGRIEVRRIDPV